MLDVREPGPQDVDGLVDLKIAWSDLPEPPTEAERAAFRDHLAAWTARMGDAVVCRVAVDGDQVVGMAWAVVFERVPNADEPLRRTADLQSVAVVPSHRGRGVGRALVDAVLAEVDRRGIPRTTVHSSARAVPLYERAGFRASPELLQRIG